MDFNKLMQVQDQSGATAGTLVLTAFERARDEHEAPYEAARSGACVAFQVCKSLHDDDTQALSAAHDAALWLISLTPGYASKYGNPYVDADHIRDEVWDRRSMCYGVAQRAKQNWLARTARIEANIESAVKNKLEQAQKAEQAQAKVMAGMLAGHAQAEQHVADVKLQNEHNMNVALRSFCGRTACEDDLVLYALTCCCIACQQDKIWSPDRYMAAFAANTKPKAQGSVLAGLFPIPLDALPSANIQLDVRGTPPIGTGYPALSGLAGSETGMLDSFLGSLKDQAGQALKDISGSAFKIGGDTLKAGTQKVLASALATGQTKVAQKLNVAPESVTKQQLQQEMAKDPSIGAAMQQQALYSQQQIRKQGLGTGAWVGIGVGAFALLALIIGSIVYMSRRQPKAA